MKLRPLPPTASIAAKKTQPNYSCLFDEIRAWQSGPATKNPALPFRKHSPRNLSHFCKLRSNTMKKSETKIREQKSF